MKDFGLKNTQSNFMKLQDLSYYLRDPINLIKKAEDDLEKAKSILSGLKANKPDIDKINSFIKSLEIVKAKIDQLHTNNEKTITTWYKESSKAWNK